MARHQAIAAVAAAIEGLIRERYPRDAFGTLKVATYQYKDFEKGIADEGFGILLWRMTVNIQRRARGPRTDIFGQTFQPSLPIDLSFLVVPIANDAEKQLRMLGWVLRTLEDAGPFTAAQLNNYLAEDDIFADAENVDILCDALGVADQVNLWDRMRKHPLYANYLMRMVLIDSDRRIDQSGPVLERAFAPLDPAVVS